MQIRAVLFDLDETLVFSVEAWFVTFQAAGRHFGRPAFSRREFEEMWRDGDPESAVKGYLPGISKEEIFEFVAAELPRHADLLKVEPDAEELLGALRRAGIATAVVTNGPALSAAWELGQVGLDAGPVIAAGDVKQGKPAPEMVLLALERLGVAPGQALLVGDSSADREAARAAGVRFAGYRMPGEITLARLGDLLGELGIDAG